MSTMTVPAALPRRPRVARVALEAPRRLAGPAAAPVRLTGRGRLVMSFAVLAAALGILGVAAPQAFALGQHDRADVERVTLRPGETLWAIAQRTTPGVDPRETVARIQSMNGLSSSTVAAGRVLVVPTGR
jgi:LysM repeat protein